MFRLLSMVSVLAITACTTPPPPATVRDFVPVRQAESVTPVALDPGTVRGDLSAVGPDYKVTPEPSSFVCRPEQLKVETGNQSSVRYELDDGTVITVSQKTVVIVCKSPERRLVILNLFVGTVMIQGPSNLNVELRDHNGNPIRIASRSTYIIQQEPGRTLIHLLDGRITIDAAERISMQPNQTAIIEDDAIRIVDLPQATRARLTGEFAAYEPRYAPVDSGTRTASATVGALNSGQTLTAAGLWGLGFAIMAVADGDTSSSSTE